MPYQDQEKRREWFRKRYEKNCEWVRNFKLKQGCKDCGYNLHHAGLEFDHINDKVCNVSSLVGRSMKMIQKELIKCEVVCGTCHGIRTWERNH